RRIRWIGWCGTEGVRFGMGDGVGRAGERLLPCFAFLCRGFRAEVCLAGRWPKTVAGVSVPRGTLTPQGLVNGRLCSLGSCAGPWSHSATVPACHVFSAGHCESPSVTI